MSTEPARPEPSRSGLNLAFFRLIAKAKFAGVNFAAWFRPDHALYVFELLDDADKPRLLNIFRHLDARLERGACSTHDLFDGARTPRCSPRLR